MSTPENLQLAAIVQGMLVGLPPERITVEAVRSRVAAVLVINDHLSDADPAWVEAELIRRGAVWVDAPRVLIDNTDHRHWLVPSRKEGWRYTARYLQWLRQSGLPQGAIDGIDRSTDLILKQLEDPLRPGPWDRRGLVVGHVQSGKTSNYTCLINKAADAGYKIIIVLAGMHNNLRSQTQRRLDEGFLGFESVPPRVQATRELGVGLIDQDREIRPNFATNRSDNGDFREAASRNLGISPEQRPWLFVVKKNQAVLRSLLSWIQNHVANDVRDTARRVTHLPLLMIDDEADHASVDTAADAVGPDGLADPDHEPTAINRLIRRLLHTFDRSALVGYTATPFANIFIHEEGETPTEGRDLFPSAFILNLGAPSNYIGPLEVFGRLGEDGREGGLPLVRCLDDLFGGDHGAWVPASHRNGYRPPLVGDEGLPESLAHAVAVFLLGLVIREARGQGKEHCSMLVHVTRFQSVQAVVAQQIEDHVRRVRQRLLRGFDDEALWERLEEIWVEDVLPTSAAVSRARPEDEAILPTWEVVRSALPGLAAEVEVRVINGSARDVLDYADRQDHGLKVIAVGGDKLSRGLTLEGLTVSYFLRASRMYDTLMQMGRWFGYRPSYLDVCRLYLPEELQEWFGLITDASTELREEFDLMEATGATPREYGLRVQSHPNLLITSRVKMRSGRDIFVSFSGESLETVVLRRDLPTARRNLAAAEVLFGALGPPAQGPDVVVPRPGASSARWRGWMWEERPAEAVLEFLRGWTGHADSHKVNSLRLAEFIEKMNTRRELTRWTVATVGAPDGATTWVGRPCQVVVRGGEASPNDPTRFALGRLLAPRDEAIDLDAQAWEAAGSAEVKRQLEGAGVGRPRRTSDDSSGDEPARRDPSGPAVRWVRGYGSATSGIPPRPDRGLLLVYFVDPVVRAEGPGGARERSRERLSPLSPGHPAALTPDGHLPLVGFGLSFPFSRNPEVVRYRVTNRYWSLEVGADVSG